MALLFFSGIVSMLAAVAIGFCSLVLSDLRGRFVPATVVLAIALTTVGIGIFVFTPLVWHNIFLPMPLSVAVFSALSTTIWYRKNSPQRNIRRGCCPRCGYNLNHSFLGGCPECGWRRAAA